MSTSLPELLARVGPGFFQQAFVVDDLDAARAACEATLGCKNFVVLPGQSLPYRYRGRDVECAIELGFARSGNVQIELLRPTSGEGIHVEFLETNGPGAHHFGFIVDDLDAEVEAASYGEVMAGQFGNLRFVYLDTFADLGAYVELVEDPDRMMMQLCPWR
jgi:hypothetical protein